MNRVMIASIFSAAIALFPGAPAKPCRAADDAPPRVRVEFRRAQDEPVVGFNRMRIEGTKDTVFVHDQPDFVLTPGDIKEATVGRDERDQPAVMILFNETGREKMGALTGTWVGKRLALIADGKLLYSPVINTKITDAAMITGAISEVEVHRIARSLLP